MTINQRGFAVGGALLCAGFALLVGCSASDSTSSPLGENQEALRKPTPQAPRHGRPTPKPVPGHGNGHGLGHGHGDKPCNHPGPGTPGSGSGGGSSNGSGGSSASAGSSSGGSWSSAGSSSGGASSAGSGGFGGGAPAVCGDGMYGGYEQCDDGNTASGDGCSSQCQLEPNYACDSSGAPCTPIVCGDGRQQGYVLADGSYTYEACDDGNTASGDGCTASCAIEGGWICEQPGTACRQPVCGDSKQDSWFVPGPGPDTGAGGGPSGSYYYEECDDGNATSGDGCTSTCTTEAGWICQQPGEACREPVCGDGFVDFIAGSGGSGSGGGSGSSGSGGFGGGSPSGSYESCDDGNTVSGDGCDAACSVEVGWNCDYWDQPCHRTVCGDGFTDYPAEQCDDGNTRPNDGCTRDCTWENQGGFGGSNSGNGGFGGGSSGSGGFGGTG